MRGAKTPATTLATLLVAIALIPASFTGSAWHIEDTPDLLHAGGGEGPGWVMYRFDPAGGHIVIDLEVPVIQDIPIVEVAMMFYNQDLALQFGFAFTAFLSDEGVYVNSTSIGDDDGPLVDTYGEYDPGGSMAMGTEINPPGTEDPLTGTHYIALWAAGGIGEHHHSFYGDEDVELFEVTEGDSAYYYVTQDFEGPLTARASMGPLGVRGVAAGALEHTIEGNLLGLFASGFLLPSADVLTVEKPDGSLDTCFCFWTQLAGPDANGPGSYTLGATGATATLNSGDHVRASVVDVQIPNQQL